VLSWDTIGFWAGVTLPLWDIPLIVRIIKRKSSSDISLSWIAGFWICSVLMTPPSFIDGNKLAMGFNTVNVIMLSIVLVVVLKYRKGQ
jgi:uncharacterized protein with PQ loop repeat